MDYRAEYRIADLIRKQWLGVITPEEQEELESWRQGENHTELYDRILSEREFVERNGYVDVLDMDRAWYEVKNRLSLSPDRMSRFSVWYRAVACAVLLVGAVMLLLYSRHGQKQEENVLVQSIVPGSSKAVLITAEGKQIVLQDSLVRTIQIDEDMTVNNTGSAVEYRIKNTGQAGYVGMKFNTVVVPRGGEYGLHLADGTKVWLNSDSELRFPVRFTGENRQVMLKGEAFFAVAKDSLRPFVVNAGGKMDIEVLGTEFNVCAYPEDEVLRTTLNKGKVRVGIGEKRLELNPDQQAVWHVQRNTLEMREVNAGHYSAWKDGKFIFEDECLESILNRLARWYNISFFYPDSGLKEFHFTGDLEKYDDFSVALRMLEKSANIRFQITGRTVAVRVI